MLTALLHVWENNFIVNKENDDMCEKRESLPTTKEQAFQPPLLDLRIGFPLMFTVPSCV